MISVLFVAGCGTTLNILSPDHIRRVHAQSVIEDSNGPAKIKYDGWYISDRTMKKVMKAKAK
jgi:hypothetical protein